MPQFFVDINQFNEEGVTITGENFHHLVRVRRVLKGEKIFLRASDGRAFEAVIESVGTSSLRAVPQRELNQTALYPHLTVYLCLLKGGNFELALQKCVESGVSAIVPVISERTVPDIKGKAESRLERWRKISTEAAKQCLRNNLAEIKNPISYDSAIKAASGSVKILAHPEGESYIGKYLKNNNPPPYIDLFIGPEGGFSPGEISSAQENDWIILNAGPNHLRAETAAIVIPAIILYEWSGI